MTDLIQTNDFIRQMEIFGKSLPTLPLDEARKVDFAQVDLRVEHHFSLGIYARTLYIPKGAIVVGKLHKFPQLNILAQGEVSIEGERFKAPLVICSPAGTKRAAFAHEDTVWITVHGTHETDLDKLEDHFIARNEEEYIEFINQQLRLPL